MAGKLGPFRLRPWFSERVWGRRSLAPWYASTGTEERVGEAWLTGPASVVDTGEFAGATLAEVVAQRPGEVLGGGVDGDPDDGPPEFPLLVKLLFPEEKLSVQVHPDDAQAQAMGQPRGKTECWYVLEAEPGAAVALGMKPGSTPERVRAAIADGTMEDLMRWVPVAEGDMIFVDAGTVHAIGPGVVLLETQQTSDTTFRMYDYGRPRELHVEQGLRVMKAETKAGKVAPRAMEGFTRLIEQRYFTVDRYEVAAGGRVEIAADRPGCLVGLTGAAAVEAAGAERVELVPGQAVVVPAAGGQVVVRAQREASFVRCFASPLR
jgi:mannose-6-phosphate isomerase